MPDVSQLSDEEILRNLPDKVILQQAGIEQQAQSSPARKIINTIFAPSNMVRAGVSDIVGRQVQTAQDVLGATPVGQIARAATVEPFRTLVAMMPQQVGRIAGTAASLPFDPTTYMGAGALSVPNRIARMLASGAVGVASPALQSYGQTGDVDVSSSALGGLLGTVAGAVAKVNPRAVMTGEGSPLQAEPLPNIPITTASKARALQAIREGFLSAPKIAGEEFEQGLNRLAEQNPNQRVDLSGVVRQLQDAELTTPGVKSTISRAIRTNKHAAFVESLLSQDPENASNLTIQEAQALKRTLQDSMRNKWNQFAPELNDVHLELQDAWHGTRTALLAAFPEMQDVLSAYGQQLNRFRALKPLFKQGQLGGAIMGKLAEEPETRTMAQQLLPEETLRKIGLYRRTQQVTDLATLRGLRTLFGGRR